MVSSSLPVLDLTQPGFSTRSKAVHDARAQHWCARTPFGLAILRHRQAAQVLRDRRFRQGSYSWPEKVGLDGSFAAFWKRSVISQEGDRHKALRRAAQAALAEAHILALDPSFTEAAEHLCDRLIHCDTFEIVEEFTEPFAGHAIVSLLGLPQDDALEVAWDASRLGLAMGPDAKSHEAVANAACDRLSALAERLIDTRPDGSFVARLCEDTALDRQSLIDLIVISIFGGVDTTRAQLAFAAHLFATHPEQWTWLRAHPEAVPEAINEVIRMRPTTTWATREATETMILEDVTIAEGETVHVLVHATATDPETGHSGTFDIRVRRKMHFGFGGGTHHCLGHLMARTDMAAALRVWLRRWVTIEPAGTPDFLPDSGNTSPVRMPLRAVWAVSDQAGDP